MIWMLDTDTVGHLINRAQGSERVKRRISGRSPGEIRISAITVAEIQFGLASGEVGEERRGALAEFLDLFQLEDFPVGAGADYGEIRARLDRAGTPIGPYDLLIAAHARHIGATLVTNNEAEFRRVPGLAVQNWLKPS
jgi:tRNA(fMet)-specific endonuclease VapC